MNNLTPYWLVVIFIVSGSVIWIAGIHLAKTTDKLSKRLNLGQALSGLIILAIVTNLPEIAITISASLQNKTELAVGNLLGGIAVQTVVLVFLDFFGLGKKGSLMSRTTSLEPALEALLVITVLIIVIIGRQMPASLIFLRITPATLLILISWIVGIYLLSKAKNGLPWRINNGNDAKKINHKQEDKEVKMGKTVIIFLISALATLVAGVALEKTSDNLSKIIHMDGVIFGATVLAAATSLPELSTGLAAIKQKDYDLAISDIFGGNSFLPVLLLIAVLCSGNAILPTAKNTDIYLTALGILLTCIYIFGIIFRPKKQVFRMGIDSLTVLLVYILSIAGLFILANK